MTKPWCIENFIEIQDGALSIDGKSATELANEFGTPLFVFSEERIDYNIRQISSIAEVINCKLKVCYASKANSLQGILRAVKRAGSDVEVNSGGELFMALNAGFSGEQIIFNGTSKTEDEIQEAIEAEIFAIQADSVYEVERILRVANGMRKRANVSLRMVPEVKSETLHGLQTALRTSKFGMMPDDARETYVKYGKEEYLNLCGVHLHIGSQNPSSEPYSEALIALFDCIAMIFEESGIKVEHANLGGGFPVNYLRDSSNTENLDANQRSLIATNLVPSEIMAAAWQSLTTHAEKSGYSHLLENFTLLLEPGRSIISDTGALLSRIQNKKLRPISVNGDDTLSGVETWLLTDAGFNLLLSMELYKWYYQMISADRAEEPHETKYKVAGPLCDGGDVYFDIEGEQKLPDHRLLPENVEVGEIFALLNAGAYTTSQMFPYNGQKLPAVILIRNDGSIELVRKKDSYEDLLLNQL
ncbi:MAG: diaminopimelate decarboxylase [Pyrinomonadaceae bacterium]